MDGVWELTFWMMRFLLTPGASSETGDQLDVDICFDKGVADLLDHGLKGLFIQSGRPGQVVDGGIDAAAEILQNHPG
jgi:hypothetical protein